MSITGVTTGVRRLLPNTGKLGPDSFEPAGAAIAGPGKLSFDETTDIGGGKLLSLYGLDEQVFGLGKMGIGELGGNPFAPSPIPVAPNPTPPESAPPPIGTALPGGSVGSLGGEYSVLDQYNASFIKAAKQFGVPVNALKAIAAIERGWEGGGVSPSGAQGIMQVMPQYWGNQGYDIYTVDGNIMAGALAYKSFYDTYKDEAIQRGLDPYEAAARAYLAGNPWSGATDYYGTSTNTYGARFSDFYGQLGGSSGAGGPSGVTASLQTILPQGTLYDWGEFNTPSGNGLYDYGRQYGLDGLSHTGLDVAMPRGSALRAPMGGVVMCAGTGVGQGADGGGCSSFQDTGTDGPGGSIKGVGRIEVLLDNGAVLIYGHSGTSALRPGQRFNAGDVLGGSGGMNSEHAHLEARVRDASTPSGWRIVDPRTVIGNGQMTGGGVSAPSSGPVPYWQRMREIINGG